MDCCCWDSGWTDHAGTEGHDNAADEHPHPAGTRPEDANGVTGAVTVAPLIVALHTVHAALPGPLIWIGSARGVTLHRR